MTKDGKTGTSTGRTGLRIAFVITQIGAFEFQSLPLLAALARERGHHVQLVEYNRNPRKAISALTALAPHIIGYSVCSNEEREYLDINQNLKAHLRFLSVFGGPHPTFTPSMIREEGVDTVCQGEGDLVFPVLLDRFGSEEMYETGNCCFKLGDGSIRVNPLVDLISDLDSLPFQARDLFYEQSYFMARNPIKAFQAGRGCPYACSYCFNHAYQRIYKGKGRLLRTKRVPYLLAEIRDVARRYPLGFVRFYDDIFGSDLDWLGEFAERFPEEIGVPFTCYMRPNLVTERYVSLLKQAGCYAVYTAIECGNEQTRNTVLNRRISNEEIIEAVTRIKQADIRVFSFNMVGMPGETEEDIFETIHLNRRLGVHFADASVFQPYPGTPAFDYCKEHGLLSDNSGHFESVYVGSILNVSTAIRQRIYVLHKLFTFLVDHSWGDVIARHFPNWACLNGLLNLVHRIYYAYFLHRRIYASAIPLWVRLRSMWVVLLSRNRV